MATEPIDPHVDPPPAQAEPRPEPKPEIRREDVLQLSWKLSRWPNQPPSPEAFAATVRRLSQARRIGYLDHGDFRFETRFKEMGRDVFDMYHVLEDGIVDGNIEAGKKEGEWTGKMVAPLEGTSRKMGVVPIVVQEKRLLIKTVEWEDR